MPDAQLPSDRTAAQRQADHADLARLSDALVPALVQKLNGSGLGELEVREGDWRIRLRRAAGTAPHPRRERQRPSGPGPRPVTTIPVAAADPHRASATSPAVGVFRAVAAVGNRLRAGDRVGVVDLLGIPQDVPSPIDGVLVELLVETGQAVEYGEELAVVAESALERPDAAAGEPGPGGEG